MAGITEDDSMTRTRLFTIGTLGVLLPLIASFGPMPRTSVEAQRGPLPDGWVRVSRLVDGDTVDVDSGQRVRLFGIDAPEAGARCGREATDQLRGFLTDRGRDYWVYAEAGPRRVDQFGRALAYLWVYDGGDEWYLLDEWMAFTGAARAWTADGQYRQTIINAERDAQANRRGCLWAGGAPAPVTAAPPPPPTMTCHPSYPDFCIPPPPPDLDCRDIGRRRFRVLPPDPHRLDGDGDGIGCE
jgi:micrococcal nuclease